MKPALNRYLDQRRARPRHQFGQAGCASTFGGSSGCTHTALQDLIQLWTGRILTHDDISRIAGYPWPSQNRTRRGLQWPEVQRVFRHFGLPYVMKSGLTVEELLRASNLAPALVGIRYGDHPRKQGLATPNVFRNGPAELNGATQRAGFDGAHAAVLAGYEPHRVKGVTKHYDAYVVEPNHGSASRPEKPAYDVITTAQLRRAFEAIKTLPRWNATYAFVATRALPIRQGGV